MPLITTFPDTTRAYMRVEVNWADVAAVQFARVLRVEPDGTCTPLRPYVCFDGDYLKLSCGHGIFWDTELPLDTPVHYITEGLDAPCAAVSPLLFDTFSRVSASTWTTPDIGAAYSIINGVAANYTVGAGVGTIAVTATGSDRISWSNVGQANQNALITVPGFATPTGAPLDTGIALRITDVNNYYLVRVQTTTAPAITVGIFKRVAGVLTQIDTSVTPANVTDTASAYTIRAQITGSTIQMRAWQTSAAEPTAWDLTVVDTALTTGNGAGAYARRQGGNLTPTSVSFDNFTVTAPCVPCVPLNATTGTVTMASEGIFAFGDPVRPCNDLRVPLCFTQPTGDPACVPGNGVFFASMGDEQIDSNSIDLLPTNADLPITMSRQNRGIASILTLVTRTFADRDSLKALLKPGGPVLFRGVHVPNDYGIDNEYISVASLNTARGLTDHRYPVRINDMPYNQTRRPAGPSQGVCGSQVDDMCDIYPTWQAIQTAGLNWDDLIRGRASHDGGDPLADYRTWTVGANTVLGDFANWTAVNTAGRTWTTLEEGA